MSLEENAELAARVRRHRIACGLTQEELAERAGVSTRTISDIERGIRRSVYRDTAARMALALDLEEPTREEFLRVARGRPAHGGSDPSTGIPISPMPEPLTELIGRQRELDALASLLADGVRLVTITGPGGIGKTRLAIEVARRFRPHRSDSFFIELADLSDATLLGAAVARAVGLPLPEEPIWASIAAHLRDTAALVVLDTFEHVLPSARSIAELVGATPDLVVLVTSRSPLRVRGEQEFPLVPLGLPSEGADDSDALRRYPSVKLFIERARAISPGLKEDEATLRSIAEICLRLDGLPLAIELAAARVKHLLPSALEQRLADRLRLLVGGPLDLPARQQSMRDTLQWSYDLLTDDERVLFRRLSIFAGGWSLEAAAVVCLDEQEDALDLMSALVDHSLVTLMPSTEPRYRMLDVIREFGALELARDRAESEALRSRHASYFVALVESAEPHLQGPKQELWAARLENDHDNIRSAVLWCIEAGQAELALRLAGASWRFWRIRGYALEGRNWLESALALDDAAVAPVARNKALWGAAWLAFHRGDYARARSLGLELQSNASQDVEIRNALTILGHIALAQGHSEEAVAGMGRALERCSDQKGSWLFATSVMNLGIANAHAAHLRPARQQLEQALGLYAELGDAYFVARARCYLALVALLEERPSEAHSVAVAALRISVDLDDEWGIAEALEWLGAAAAARGRAGFAGYLVAAASRLREAMTLQQMPFDAAAIERQIATARVTAEWSEQLEAGRNASLEEVLLAVFEEGSHSSPSS